MKNIMILSPDRLYESMGGLGVHLNEIVQRIDTSLYDITILCNASADYTMLDGKIKIYGINVDVDMGLAVSDLSAILIYQTRYVSRFMQLLNDGCITMPDMLHVCDWTTAVAGEEICRMTGAKMVFAVHLSVNVHPPVVSDLHKIALQVSQTIEWNACTKADRILQVSNTYSRNFPFMMYAHKTTVVHNGVDFGSYANASKEFFSDTGKNQFKILYLGRIAYDKNPQSIWSMRIPDNVDLIFIGGEQGSDDELVETLGYVSSQKDNLHYLGGKYGQDKIDALASADLVVMPSTHEPFGMVALEALAAGQNGKTVLAASFVDGLGEFLTEEAAINCGVTVESIQAAVDRFLAMTEEEKMSMREKGCELARKYTWQKCADGIMECWREAMGM